MEETPAVICLKQSDVFGLWQDRQTPSLNRKIPPSAAFSSQKAFFPTAGYLDETNICWAEICIALDFMSSF